MNMDQLENKMEELISEINKLKSKSVRLETEIDNFKNKNENKRWRAKYGEYYWYINDEGIACREKEFGYECDNFRYKTGNYFKTEEQAKKQKMKTLIYVQLKDLALRLNNGKEIDWNNIEQKKYYIYFNYNDNRFHCDYYEFVRDIGQIFCLDSNFLKVALKEIGIKNLKLLYKGE